MVLWSACVRRKNRRGARVGPTFTGASNSPTGATSPSPTTWAISLKIRTGYERHAIRAVTAKRFPSLVGGSE